jgi:hypothetical protein
MDALDTYLGTLATLYRGGRLRWSFKIRLSDTVIMLSLGGASTCNLHSSCQTR